MLKLQDMTDKYGKDIEEVCNRIVDYGWNTPWNNWGGHHFSTTDGYEFITDTVPGHYVPEGEKVSVYRNGVKVFTFTYMLNDAVFSDIIEPLTDFVRENTGCDYDHAVAVAEYIFAIENCPSRPSA